MPKSLHIDHCAATQNVDFIDVESAVSHLKHRIWNNRHSIWGNELPDPVDMLRPDVAARLLGWSFESWPEIPNRNGDRHIEIAGLIDPQIGRIVVSEKLGPELARFTGAHEIGHCLLHKPTTLYREMSTDAEFPIVSDHKEQEANRFAAQFLMPEKLLQTSIEASFGMSPPIVLDETNAFWLDRSDYGRLLDVEAERLAREFAFAAGSINFRGQQIVSLHEQFKVSKTAMAIRLEELGWIRV